ncbi:MAG: hypothetical protein NWQ16_11895, partial [Akkermansiaceae bacterium]|nr:hypothetical protein [Akkermansiaceae bacterium]
SGISLEAYARQILQQASRTPEERSGNLLDLSRRYFSGKNGVDLVLPSRASHRIPVDFDR